MAEHEQRVEVTLDLGAISLTTADLLALRCGQQFGIQASEPLQGTLRLSGNAWAKIEITREAEALQIKIVELLNYPHAGKDPKKVTVE